MFEQITDSVIAYTTFLRLVDNSLAEAFARTRDVLLVDLKADIHSLSITTVSNRPVVFVEYIINGHVLCVSVHPNLVTLCKVPLTYKGKRTIPLERFTDKELTEYLTCLLPVNIPPLS